MLFPKILTYALNAYLDAQIAEEIATSIRTNGKSFATIHTTSRQRAEHLINTIPTAKKDPSYLIGLAYTQYYINGLADILYTDLLWPLLLSSDKATLRQQYKKAIMHFRKQLSTSYQYDEILQQPFIRLWYWPVVVIDPWHWAKQFADKRCGYKGSINRESMRQACIAVQRQNIQNNRALAKVLKTNQPSTDPKAIALRDVAQQSNQDASFIMQAAATQEAAARWDTLFTRLLPLHKK